MDADEARSARSKVNRTYCMKARAFFLSTSLASIALVASRRRFEASLELLRDSGLSAGQLARVKAPAGLDIAASTPEEIAVSILAEMIAVRRGVAPEAIRPMRAQLPGRMRVGSEP